MTGYGHSQAQTTASTIEVSFRSVNGRFLESRFHLPREYVGFESDLKKIMSKYVKRGTVDVFVSRRVKLSGKKTQLQVNTRLAKEYLQAFNQLSRELKLKTNLQIDQIARLPEVFKLEESFDVPLTEKKVLYQAFEKACQAADQERKREGKSLRTDLEKVLNHLDQEITDIQHVREEANKTLLDRFEQKIKSKLTSLEIDSTRLSQEVVLQLEKTDINEELTRLKEHIKNYRQLLHSAEAEGKKLDFYTQELLREVNTIGSKSSISKLTQIVVQSKTYIERLREQVQNVE